MCFDLIMGVWFKTSYPKNGGFSFLAPPPVIVQKVRNSEIMEETSSTINIPERRGNCAPKNWTPGNGSPFYGRVTSSK